MADLREVDGITPLPSDELAAWLRDYAERAERGEIFAAAVVVVTRNRSPATAWFDDAGMANELVAGTTLLAHRVAKAVVERDD